MNVKGKIKVITDTKEYGSNGFKKRSVVVVTQDGERSQPISIELHNDKTDLLNQYSVGDVIDVSINLRGKEWVSPQGETKYFNTLVGWKIEGDAIVQTPEPSKPQPQSLEYQDDLPF